MARRKLKLNIPAGTTLCPKCEGMGCDLCGGKGYYDAHVDRQTPVQPPRPTRPCGACGSMDWWWREPRMIFESYSRGEWLCGRCYPNHTAKKRKEESNG